MDYLLQSFLNGLEEIRRFDADVMCTGHGGILVGDINQFISELLEIGYQLQKQKRTCSI